jgi:hypothetical protein
MKTERFAYTIFCDDIRQEINQKHSLIGCYSGVMLFNELPATLGKVCFNTVVQTSVARPFEKLTVRAILNKNRDEPLVEFEISPEDLKEAESKRISIVDAEIAVVNLLLTIGQIVFEDEGQLCIEIETEDETLEAGKLAIRKRLSS